MTVFIMHIANQECGGCGHHESLSTLYQAEALPQPGRAHKLLPCHSIGPHDHVHKIELPVRNTPICGLCANSSPAGADVYARWQETLRRKATPDTPRPTVPARKSEPTLDDLA